MKILTEKTFSASETLISDGVIFIRNQLSELGCSDKRCAKLSLLSEEVMLQMVHHSRPDAIIRISIGKKIKKHVIRIKCQGEKFEISGDIASSLISDTSHRNLMDDEQTDIISNMILKSYSNDFSLKNKKGFNNAEINVDDSVTNDSYFVFLCMILGLITGILLKMILPTNIEDILSTYVFDFISQIFLKGIQAVVAPLVFFSISESMADASDLSVFGRMGGKVMISYLFTTIVAILIGFGIFNLIHPGDPAMRSTIDAIYGSNTSATETVNVSAFATLCGIIPDNLVNSFSNADMLQIIVIAILVGIASGAIGEYSEPMQTFLKTGSALFQKITEYITKLLPAAVFCLMANMIITTEYSVIMQLSKCIITELIAILCMMAFYACLLAFVGRINPFSYFKACKESILTAFTTCSSSVAMPTTMKCLDNFGVSPKIYSFSIPLGTTINMDGGSVEFVVLTMFMARIYGITLSGTMLISFFLTVVLLSMATPAGAGTGLALETMLLLQIGVPGATIGFIVPIITLCDFIVTTNNVVGDGVVTTIVAKSEGLLKSC